VVMSMGLPINHLPGWRTMFRCPEPKLMEFFEAGGN
jgi:hypothetical protein